MGPWDVAAAAPGPGRSEGGYVALGDGRRADDFGDDGEAGGALLDVEARPLDDDEPPGALVVSKASSTRRRRRWGKACRSASAGFLGFAFVAGVAVVVKMQRDVYRATIWSIDIDAVLRDLVLASEGDESVVDFGRRVREAASPAYEWLAQGSPKALVPWEAIVERNGREEEGWTIDDPDVMVHHCGREDMVRFVKGLTNFDRCGPWAPERPAGCAGGYYARAEAAAAAPVPCPFGMFCPEGFTCFVACLYGATCTRSVPVGEQGHRPWCNWPVHLPHELVHGGRPYHAHANETVVCPGVRFEALCPAGYFCADTTRDPELCPRRHSCAAGTFEPKRCPFFATCDARGLAAPDVAVAAAAALLFGFAVCCILFRSSRLVRDRLRALREDWRERRSVDRRRRRQCILMGDDLSQTLLDDEAEGPPPPVAPHSAVELSRRGAALDADADDETPCLAALTSLRPKSASDRIDMEFEQLTVDRKIDDGRPRKRRLLDGVTGRLLAGRVTAIMGPSGAGKTTLLSVLSGRVDRRATVTGVLRIIRGVEGLNEGVRSLRPLMGFVPQEDIMCRALTVKELLDFSAATRLPASADWKRRAAVVEEVLAVLKLRSIRHRVVGDVLNRGISGGQRKRVNVGLELVADPTVLFADEPTTGLDSATSLDLVEALQRVARNGAAVAAVVHQPSIQIYELFDEVLLLAPGGRVAYLGHPSGAKPWFAHLGAHVPETWSPPDFFMRLLADHDDAAASSAEASSSSSFVALDFPAEWAKRHRPPAATTLRAAPANRGDIVFLEARPGFGRQLWLQLRRAATTQRRSATALAGDVALQIVAGGGLGLLYVDYAYKNLQLVNFMVAISLGMTVTLAAVQTFAEDRAVFLRECHEAGGGGLSTRAYFVAKSLADVPRLVLLALVFVVAFFPLARPRASFPAYATICVCDAMAASGAGYVASVALQPKTAQLGALCIALIFALLSGVQPTVRQMPAWLHPLHYLSHDRYLVQALYVDEIAQMSEASRLTPAFYPDGAESSVLAQLLNYGYLVHRTKAYFKPHHDLRTLNLVTLLTFALVFRLAAYVVLIHTNVGTLGRRTLGERLATCWTRSRRPKPSPAPSPRTADARLLRRFFAAAFDDSDSDSSSSSLPPTRATRTAPSPPPGGGAWRFDNETPAY